VATRHFGAFQKTFRCVVGHGNPPALPFYGSSVRSSRLRNGMPSPALKASSATIEP
jgi:hypothetical protein